MGFVADAVGAVVKAVGSVVKAVVSNPLQVIETVALTAIAGPAGAALSEVTSGAVSAATGELLVNSVGRAAIAAANGGSMASIVGGAIAPVLSSPIVQNQIFGTTLNNAISPVVSNIISDPTIAKVVTGAVGSATVSGAIAGITGQNVADAAIGAGLGSAVAQTVNKLWTNIQSAPKVTDMTNQYKDLYGQVQGDLPTVNQAATLQNDVNSKYATYTTAKTAYDDVYQKYLDAKNQNNVDLANQYADQLNGSLGSALSDAANAVNSANQSFTDYYNANKSVLDNAIPIVNQMGELQKQYNIFNDQTLGDYNQIQLAKAIQAGDYVKAADIQAHIQDLNTNISQIDPNASISQSILTDPSQIDLLNKIQNAPDQATKDQLISQAKLNPYFQDIATDPKYNIPTTQQSSDSIYQQLLPKLPDSGVETPTVTPTTTPTIKDSALHVDTSTLNPVTSAVQGIIKNAITSGITSQLLGGNTPTTPPTTTPTKTSPPKHVDVSTLKPFTGTLPTGLGTPTTPTTNQPTTTPVGGLNQATNTPQTTTQTVNSGLTSTTQPQVQASNKPAQHVDISTLSPVTNQAQLANLGLNLG